MKKITLSLFAVSVFSSVTAQSRAAGVQFLEDILLIDTSSRIFLCGGNVDVQPMSGAWLCKYVYTNSKFMENDFGYMNATILRSTVVADIRRFEEDMPIYAKTWDYISKKDVLVELGNAFAQGEAVVEESKMFSPKDMFTSYLRSKPSITDNHANAYLKTFGTKSRRAENEFEERRWIAEAKEDCMEVKARTLKSEYIMFGKVELPKYDFSTGGFMVQGMLTERVFNFKMDEDVADSRVYFSNMESDEMLVKVETNSAETITKYLSTVGSRTVYYVYTFSLGEGVERRIAKKHLGMSYTQGSYIQKASVKQIDFYLEADYITKIATIRF